MDFLDYQTFITTDTSTDDNASLNNSSSTVMKSVLPEPAKRLVQAEGAEQNYGGSVFGTSAAAMATKHLNEANFANALTNQFKRMASPYLNSENETQNSELQDQNQPEPSLSENGASPHAYSAQNIGGPETDQKMNKYLDISIKFLESANTTAPVDRSTLTSNNQPIKLPNSEYSSSFNSQFNAASQKSRANTSTKVNHSEQILASKISQILNDSSLNNASVEVQPNNFRKSLTLLQSFIYDSTTTASSAFLDYDSPNTLFEVNEILRTDFVGVLQRKAMKPKLEQTILKEHEYFLQQYAPIIEKLKIVQPSVARLLDLKKEIQSLPQNSINPTVDVLQTEIHDLKLEKKVLIGLKGLFTLDQLEDDILHNGKIDQDFFDVINKLLLIKKRCVFILSETNENFNVLLNKINSDLQLATRKIYNSLMDFLYHFDFSTINASKNTNSTVGNNEVLNFQKKLIYLSNDLEYFNSFLTRIVEIRSKKCLDNLFAQFDLNNTKKPIVLTAHDPVRYLADVLAYVHSLIVNEDDFVNSLLKFQHIISEDTPKTILQENSSFLSGLDSKILNDIFIKLSNTIKIRLEQIIRFENNSLKNLEIIQLLKLYHMMYTKYGILEENVLLKNLKELSNISKDKIFQDFLDFTTNQLQKVFDISNADLLPPDWLPKYLNKLTDFLLKLETDTAIFDDDNMNKMAEELVKTPLTTLINQQIVKSYPMAKRDPQVKTAMLIIKSNCYDLIKTRLLPFHHTIFNINDSLQNVYDSICKELVVCTKFLEELQNKTLLINTGLENYFNLFNMVFPVASVQDELDYEMYYSIKENKIMNLPTIETAVSENISDYLPRAMSDFEERLLFHLSSPVIADEITKNCFNNFSQFFRVFFHTLLLLYPEDKDLIKKIMVFNPEEVDTLIGVDD
ncbi:Conserved oligomeric Golgi complex subunit 6 [Hanseniaspora osmophila]|mgnify:CR=1 FL=1|uniref:Conserved oligomeric Golgi complex subunit 6 n=1 Tax=Hanseniaspora osmophila TaxID=56408 RepID=A0A1E5RN33_9ASCO|nr:Conserved oligomeric Golgi complex subunit 6 [Hanseniaspora osmophila]